MSSIKPKQPWVSRHAYKKTWEIHGNLRGRDHTRIATHLRETISRPDVNPAYDLWHHLDAAVREACYANI